MELKGNEIETIDDFTKFKDSCLNDKRKWFFRADKYESDNQKLETSLEKSFKSIDQPSMTDDEYKKHKIDAEKDIIREFQRKFHLYSSNIPTRADIIQWLALMQHHGAPTRLLDWTYSFWVAVHFATSRRTMNDKGVIWAVNGTMIMEKCKQFLEFNSNFDGGKPNAKKIPRAYLSYCDPDSIRDNAAVHHLIKKPEKMVYYAGPFRQNERITLQQGTFLITGDITASFEDNLFDDLRKYDDENYFKKTVIFLKSDLKNHIVNELRRMNINNAVLFPGLDGFSQSLWTRVGLSKNEKVSCEEKNLEPFP